MPCSRAPGGLGWKKLGFWLRKKKSNLLSKDYLQLDCWYCRCTTADFCSLHLEEDLKKNGVFKNEAQLLLLSVFSEAAPGNFRALATISGRERATVHVLEVWELETKATECTRWTFWSSEDLSHAISWDTDEMIRSGVNGLKLFHQSTVRRSDV